jgi:hypothetical protein
MELCVQQNPSRPFRPKEEEKKKEKICQPKHTLPPSLTVERVSRRTSPVGKEEYRRGEEVEEEEARESD